jgi:hypothetical protein
VNLLEQEKSNEKPIAFDITSLDTYMLLTIFINILSLQAWQHMGLRVKSGTDKIERDLERAKIAIDCIAFLIDKLENHIQESEKISLRNFLTDLQINYARITKD